MVSKCERFIILRKMQKSIYEHRIKIILIIILMKTKFNMFGKNIEIGLLLLLTRRGTEKEEQR